MSPPSLTPPDQALAQILAATSPLSPERVEVAEAVGRALVGDVRAHRTLPPWDNSAMDGYAVRSADVQTAPVTLRVTQTVTAGSRAKAPVGPGEAARIMTGAPLPEGADAVVMQERCRRDGEAVTVLEPAVRGGFVRAAGEDARAGDLLLPAGTPLGIPEASLLWAQGLLEVEVPRRPKVAILSSGDELCRPEEAGGELIVDTNSPQLALCVGRAGGRPKVLGIAPDDKDAVTALIARGLSSADVVLTSAGVSVGERDFVQDALRTLGVDIHFWRVGIKPGKPLLFGTRGKTLVFGLPGNPASSLVTYELFVRPALQRLLGHPQPGWRFVSGRAEVPLKKPSGLVHYLRAGATFRAGDLWASPLSTQTSGALRSLTHASHLIVLPADTERVEAGERISLLPVTWGA